MPMCKMEENENTVIAPFPAKNEEEKSSWKWRIWLGQNYQGWNR